MHLSPTRLRVLRSIALLLLLAASVVGFMMLIDLLAETTPQDANELLAATDSQSDVIRLPSSGSLFAIGLAAVAIIVALAIIAAPSNWRRSQAGLPRPRWASMGLAGVLALIIAVVGLFLAFADASPLFQQQTGAESTAVTEVAGGHEVNTNWVAPTGVALLAAFFFTVILIGFLRPRLILPVLALWLAASLFFGFFSSSAIAGLSLFNPVITLEVPDAFADEVAKHRTTVTSPNIDGDGVPGPDDPSSDPNRPPGTGEGENPDAEGPGGIDDIGQDAPGEITEAAIIARLHGAPGPDDRADAAQQLAEFRSDDALDALAHAGLYDPSLLVKDAALDAISEWDFETLFELLQEHPEPVIRQAAAAALGRLDDPRAVEPLATALLTDDVAEVRQESAKALRRLSDSEAVSPLIQSLLQDEDSSVRAEAATALGALEDERAGQALLETLQADTSALVREAGAKALGRIRGSNPLAELDAARVDDLSAGVREEASLALSRYTPGELIDALHNATAADDRAVAARLIGERKITVAIPDLILALNDSHKIVREAVAAALAEFGDLQELENGNSLLSHRGGTAIIPGTSTQQSSNLPHTPLYRVRGTNNLDFLRTAAGDAYDADGWLDTHTESFRYEPRERFGEIDASGSPLTWTLSMEEFPARFSPPTGQFNLPGGIFPFGYVTRDTNAGGIYRPGSSTFLLEDRRSQVTLFVTPPLHDESTLRSAVLEQGLGIGLPDSVPNRVHELAGQITVGRTTAYDKAKAIEQYLALNYAYRLPDETRTPMPIGHDPVDWFLFQSREGTGGQFSSAFVVLAQSIGLPARVVSGFVILPTIEEQIIYADLAHQRAEIAFDGLGWVAFEPTPAGEGAPGRALDYFEAAQAEAAELQRLRELAEKLDDSDSSNDAGALQELEDAGASVHMLENGRRLVTRGESGFSTTPGTTADQCYSLVDTPLFTVTGARKTGYLVDATGDVYLGHGWRQLDPVALDYDRSESVPDLVRDSFEGGREPWSDLPESRIEPILLAPDESDFDNDISVRLRVAPLTGSGRIPAGVVPVSRHANSVGVDGSYRPFSGTFEMEEPVLGYQWWSILPRLSERDLNRAKTIDDTTYTQLPDDLDARIHELAERITAGHRTPYAKARAIEQYLSSNYKYVLGKDSTKPPRPAGFDAVEWFLFETREGTCGQFSSAFTVLARSVGLPARVVSGWMIEPTPNTQTVRANQAHQWAEVAFEGIGWITFEPTAPGGVPSRVNSDGPPERAFEIVIDTGPTILPTVTDITSWPREIERGRPFIVGGTVTTERGRRVNGMEVEIFVNEIKAFGGLRIGSGTTQNGRYTIEVTIPPSIERGDYQLIAHAIANDNYFESWSDPDIAVFSQSGLVFSGPQEVNVGTEAVFRGQVTEDNGRGVPGIPVSVIIDGRSFPQRTTGEDGSFTFSNTFLLPGRHWAEVRFSDTDYLRANSARINLQAFMPTNLTLDVPVQARVDEPFTVSGVLVDWRETPLNGRQVTVTVGDSAGATVVAGVDGSFTHQVTLPSSGQVTLSATFVGAESVLPSSASASVIVRDVTVLSLEGPGLVLAGEAATFHGAVTSPTNEELEPLTVEIINNGDVITTIQTDENGLFSYDTGSHDETGPRMLTARVPEQQFLTSSTATIAYSVIHSTAMTLDGPPVAMTGQHIEFTGTLMQADGQPIADASVLLDGNPVVTTDDGTFSYVVTLPETLDGAAIEEQIGILYEFEGTDHLAPASGSRSIIVGVPHITTERTAPIARGDVALVRGTAFSGTRPLPNAAVSLTGGQTDETGQAGQFLFEYQVPPDTPIGPLQLTASLDTLGVQVPIELEIRSGTHLVAMPLDDVRPGRVAEVQVALYDDTGVGISGANLRTSTGLDLLTDELGNALFDLTVPESETLLAVPLTFTYNGDTQNMPLNYFLVIPVSPPSFNWLLWVVLPAFLLLTGAGGYGVYRLRAAGIPLAVQRWSVGAMKTIRMPSEAEREESESLSQPRVTTLELQVSGPGTTTGNVFGLDEEVVVTGRLISEDGAPIPGRSVELREPLGDLVVFDTNRSGEFRLVLKAEERGEFSLSVGFDSDSSYLGASASVSYRVVEFREEMVRVFADFMEWATRLEVGIAGQSPRETESILVSSGVPIDQRALDELVTRFEEADYSEHDIERRHYEAMHQAWRTIIGDQASWQAP